MDTQVFFHLLESIETAESAAELEVTGDLVRATAMSSAERGALERVMRTREEALRTGDLAVSRPPVARAD